MVTITRNFARSLLVLAVFAGGLSILSIQPAGATTGTPFLHAGETLTQGQELVAPSGNYFALLQTDGNFVVYNRQNHPIWATGTKNGTMLVVQYDGNVVLYAGGPGTYRPVWSSGTSSLGQVFAVIQDDGNFVVYNAVQPLWSSKFGSVPIAPVAIGVGQPLYSPSGQYMMLLQGDGNLVVYRLAASPAALWSSATVNSGAYALVIQGDGNLVLYNSSRAVWASGTYATTASFLAMQNDGNLVLYTGVNRPLWSTGTDIGAQVAAFARSQVGYVENPAGSGCNSFTAFFGAGQATGRSGQPCGTGTRYEEWCADYAHWVWLSAGAGTTGLSGWSYTFVYWGQAHGTFKQGATKNPQPGDAVVWGNMATQYGDHVGTVVGVRSDGWIQVVSGNDQNDQVGIGWLNPAISIIDGDPIVGYTSPLSASAAVVNGGAAPLWPTPSQAQINTQH